MIKAHVSTVEGQKELCHSATSRAVVFSLNNFVRSREPQSAWGDKAIAEASPDFLRAIRDDLLPIYNRLVSKNQ